jgi:hypothetical protein
METLGAFLLRSGVLDKDTLAAALDRHAVYGGWLDTSLLELGLVDESSMAAYLSQWSGHAVCEAGWLEQADRDALALVSLENAQALPVVPFALSSNGVHLACLAPVDTGALSELGGAAGRPVLPYVTTELRLRVALAHYYGVPLDLRIQELADRVLPTAAPQQPASALPEQDAPEAPPGVDDFHVTVPRPPEPDAGQLAATVIDLAEALAHLVAAQDRHSIVNITLRYALQTFPFVSFLGVARQQAVVWGAAAHPGELPERPADLQGMTLPLQELSPLETVVRTRAPSLGVHPNGGGSHALPHRLGRGVPRAVLLVPVLVGGRVAGVFYADHGEWAIRTQQASEVMAFISRVGPALENLIRQKRARSIPAGTTLQTTPVPERPLALTPALLAAAVGSTPDTDGQAAIREDTAEGLVQDEPIPETATIHMPDPSAGGVEADAMAAGEAHRAHQPPVDHAVFAHLQDGAAQYPQVVSNVPSPQRPAGEPLWSMEATMAAPADWGVEPSTLNPSPPAPGRAPHEPLTAATDARALAAAALARAQAGDHDEEDEPRESETPVLEDLAWTSAVEEALAKSQGADGAVKTADNRKESLILAADDAGHGTARAGGPAGQPQEAEEDEEAEEAEEQAKEGEEAVVFAEFDDVGGASTAAFAQALTHTIETGRQGGEVLAENDRPFSAPEDSKEGETAGWDAAVYEAMQQVNSPKPPRTGPPPLPHAASPPPLPAAPLDEPGLIDPPQLWVEALTSGVPDRMARASAKVLELGEAALPALIAVFPGRVTFDPFGSTDAAPEPASLSPLMDVLVRMGATGGQVAVAHLDSTFPAYRYFATLLLTAAYDPRSIPHLLRRLHDDEPRIRNLAGEGLAGYMAEPGFEQVMRHLRTRIASVMPEGRRRAIHFLGRFRDVGSIPALIHALRAKEPEIGQAAATALRAITLQSLGTHEKKWMAWWEKNKQRTRIEWLIDALKDGDVEVRAAAGGELAQLTRDTFGFKADGPRKDREVAVRRWERWWADERKRITLENSGTA